MMHRPFGSVALAIGLTIPVFAQDPVTTLPDAYKLELENDYVKVVRVHYDPGVKLPAHTHPAGATVYIYLNDAEGIVFRHVGSMRHVVNRPPVKSGGIRVSNGVEERHEVENTSNAPADSLRVFFKTASDGARSSRRLSPADGEFANTHMRITRMRIAAQQSVTIETKQPALIVEVPSGRQRWLAAGTSETIAGADSGELALVRIDFLTNPE